MAIPQHTIDQILDRTDIVDVIGQFVKLKKTGRTYSGCCPFHQEKSPSFHVYRDKQYFHCFGCQANGNAIRFLMDISNRNFIEVMKDLSSQTGIELPKDDQEHKKRLAYKKTQVPATPQISPALTAVTPEPQLSVLDELSQLNQSSNQLDETLSHEWPMPLDVEGDLYSLLENVAQYYQQQLPRSLVAQQYFHKRGLTPETIAYWRLGYAPEDWQHLEKAFPQDIEGLKLLGLIRTSDNGRDFDLLRDRVIFPIRDVKGRIIGFGGRALNDEIKPKYINSPDSEVFHKNQLLYGLYEGQQQKAKQWLMVEGYMDVIALQQYGIAGAVATLGTASNTEHLNLLFKRHAEIILAFDGDAAGQKAARRTLEIALPLLNDGRHLKFFVLPKEHDPDSLIRQEGVEYFQHLIDNAPLLSEFLFGYLTQQHDHLTPEGKSKIMGELRQLTDLLPKGAAYRYLLQQFFREKFGGFKQRKNFHPDVIISYGVAVDNEAHVVAMLMYYPHLYVYFRGLLEYLPHDNLLFQCLTIFEQLATQLPDDLDRARYYILGAFANYHFELQNIFKHVDLADYHFSIEHAQKLALDFADKLLLQYMQERLKEVSKNSAAVGGLQYVRKLKQEIAQLEQKRRFVTH